MSTTTTTMPTATTRSSGGCFPRRWSRRRISSSSPSVTMSMTTATDTATATWRRRPWAGVWLSAMGCSLLVSMASPRLPHPPPGHILSGETIKGHGGCTCSVWDEPWPQTLVSVVLYLGGGVAWKESSD
ncbi:hypothetical protein C2845_PM11G03520 [Panicum miliaceum]|uniref:Uncharacterized protein n=1 Tax=Panicum miliaceum TaxID=4540 RepID=A0A3L6RSS9_PANMI|nr:hypothetical protein C2845_PM11G03520 [Panicum miliaceum]